MVKKISYLKIATIKNKNLVTVKNMKERIEPESIHNIYNFRIP